MVVWYGMVWYGGGVTPPALSPSHIPQVIITRVTGEGWPLLAVENWDEWGLKEYTLKGPFLDWFVELVLPVQEIFCSALAVLVSPVQIYIFPQRTLYKFPFPHRPSKLGRQACWVVCLLVCVSDHNDWMWCSNPPVCYCLICVKMWTCQRAVHSISLIDAVYFQPYCNVVKENKHSYSYSYSYTCTSGIERRSVDTQHICVNISAAKHLFENPDAHFFVWHNSLHVIPALGLQLSIARRPCVRQDRVRISPGTPPFILAGVDLLH